MIFLEKVLYVVSYTDNIQAMTFNTSMQMHVVYADIQDDLAIDYNVYFN